MTIEVEVFGKEKVGKHKGNITGYSYSEEATPISPGDSSGGVGALSFTALDDENNSSLIFGDEVYLKDSRNGEVSGKVNSISASNGTVTFNGISNLSRLNIIKTIPAFNSNLGELIIFVFQEAGILSDINISPSISSIPVISPAYTGDLWVFLKEMCTAYEIEISLVAGTIFVRELRQNTIKVFDLISEGWSIAEINPAQYVDVNYYNYQYEEDYLAYPRGGWNKETQVYQVDAGEIITIEIPVEAYLEYVEQPIAVDFVDRYEESQSVYCIAGNDGLPIPASLWETEGGSLYVELADEGQTIVVTLTGAQIPDFAPFRVAVTAGPSDSFSSLRILGTGVFYTQETFRYPTGLTEEETSNVVGLTVENRFIDTKIQAIDAAKRAVLSYATPYQLHNFSAPNIGDFINVPENIIYADQFFELDGTFEPGLIFDKYDEDLGSKSFSDFDESLPGTIFTTGASQQLFGNVAGARVKFRDSWYRIKSATITQSQVDATAEWDNLFNDFNLGNVDKTFDNFTSTFDELTFSDFSLIPMRAL